VAGLVPLYLRGEAYLQQGDAARAIAEFERVLAHRGVDPFATVLPLSQLGLARAHARAGDPAGSRRAYEALFATWAPADGDFRLLGIARAEYGRLARTTQP